MSRPLRRRRAAALDALALALPAVADCADSGAAAPSSNLGGTLDQAVPPSVLTLPLTDPAGHQTSLAAYRSKIIVLGASMKTTYTARAAAPPRR